MAMKEVFDLEGYDDNRVEMGDALENGWYRASVSEIDEDLETSCLKFTYTVTAGDFKGRTVYDRANHPNSASDANAERVARNRRILLAKRFGLLTEYKNGVEIDWMDALDKEVFIKVQTRTYVKKDQTEGKTTGITFDGVYPPDDPRVPELVKEGKPCPLDAKPASKSDAAAADAKESGKHASGGRAKAATQSPPRAAAKQDFGDL